MAAKILKHDEEHLDNSRGAWRPTLVAKVWDLNGDPVAWDEIVVVTCPSCGCQFGVGADKKGPKITAEGKTDREVKCQNVREGGCPWNDVMEFDKHQEPEGREHFAKLKDAAVREVAAGREKRLQRIIQAQIMAELNERAMAEAKKIMPDSSDPAAAQQLAQFMKNAKKIG